MATERRTHHRIKPKGLSAGVMLNDGVDLEFPLSADIIDISRSGIRIKLTKPLAPDVSEKIKITMHLPESGEPFTVHGMLKHQFSDNECGLQYMDHCEKSVDNLLFECIKLNEMTLLIKTS
ncbi:MAG: PilZ domain-containing protein [Gammaproteobacteria bacterium HGW-Gammaproteobacteria-10]|nr:MAG: PilZ domain-containing protein [Gammaproteobacteria bacterium HGW-Gammaproteobacteria-10]